MRRQLECIAKAGGGTYVDVDDADELADELAAALSRAFRGYEPAGTKVAGGPDNRQAVALRGGLFQDALAPGEKRWYAVDVPEGRRLLTASVSAVTSYDDEGQSALRTELQSPSFERLDGHDDVLYGRAAGAGGRVRSHGLTMPDFAGTAELPPGRYAFPASRSPTGSTPTAVPVEIGVQLLQPGEAPGLHARRGRARRGADAHARRAGAGAGAGRRRRGRRRAAGDCRRGRGGHRRRAARQRSS